MNQRKKNNSIQNKIKQDDYLISQKKNTKKRHRNYLHKVLSKPTFFVVFHSEYFQLKVSSSHVELNAR